MLAILGNTANILIYTECVDVGLGLYQGKACYAVNNCDDCSEMSIFKHGVMLVL